MIPKVIHYCWFGRGEKPKLAKKCIDSWKRLCPEYEIIEWNEDNFDVSKNQYTKYCSDAKKWAFLSDYVRLVIVLKYGGIYFDTDVEVIKPLNDLLDKEAFYGFENEKYIATGLGFGAEKNNKTVEAIVDRYSEIKPNSLGEYELINCPKLNTEALIPFGLVRNGQTQKINHADIYAVDYFNPMNDATGKLSITDNTYTINHYGKSWLSKRVVLKSKIARPFHRLLDSGFFNEG